MIATGFLTQGATAAAAPEWAKGISLTSAPARAVLPPNTELCALIQAVARDGDRAAFAILFGGFAPRLKGFLSRFGLDEALAEELAQETLLTVWRKAELFDPRKASVSTWVFTIARNKRLDRLRRIKGGTPTPDASDERADTASGEELAIAAQRDEQVRAALANLPAEQALAIRLAFFAEKTHSEIAAELGVPLGTVKSRVRLALERLRNVLEDCR